MSCARHTSAIVDHACGAGIAADAAAHLEGCAACRRIFEEQLGLVQALDGQLAQALDIQPSARFVPEVIARVEYAAVRKRTYTYMWWAAPAAAAAVLILVTFGALRSGERRAADLQEPASRSTAASAPVVRTPGANASSRGPLEESRPASSRRRVNRPRDVVERPKSVEASVIVAPEQEQAVARYLTLVRSGALDTSALVRSDAARVETPAELVVAPLSVEALGLTDVENRAGPGIDGRGPGLR